MQPHKCHPGPKTSLRASTVPGVTVSGCDPLTHALSPALPPPGLVSLKQIKFPASPHSQHPLPFDAQWQPPLPTPPSRIFSRIFPRALIVVIIPLGSGRGDPPTATTVTDPRVEEAPELLLPCSNCGGGTMGNICVGYWAWLGKVGVNGFPYSCTCSLPSNHKANLSLPSTALPCLINLLLAREGN